MANADIRQGYKDAAWFAANTTLVLKKGQQVHYLQTGTYKMGDGVTQLSALSFLGASSGGGAWGSITGTLSNQTDLQNALNAKYDASNPAGYITSAALSGYGLLANPLSQFAATTSAQLRGVISDETGTGALVFNTAPTFVDTITVSGTNAVGLVSSFTNVNSAGYVSLKSVNNSGKEIGIAVFGSTSAVGTLYDVNTAWVSATADVTGIINEQATGQIVFATGTFGASGERVRISTTVTKFSNNTINIDNGTASSFMYLDASKNVTYTTAVVASVSGTSNRITSTGGATPVIDISASYVGQTSITTVGTIATGTWSATIIAINKGGSGADNSTNTSGSILRSNGTNGNFVASTATYPNTVTANSILLGTSTNVVGVNSTLSFTTNNLLIGASAPTYSTSGINVNVSANSGIGGTIQNANAGSAAFSNILFQENTTNYAYLANYNTAYSGNVPGTSLPYSKMAIFSSSGTAGGDGTAPFAIISSKFTSIIGQTGTNFGLTNDSVGIRVDTISALHSTNLNPFTVNGKSYFGGNTTATAFVHIAAGTTSISQLNLVNGVAPTSPNNGDIWFDGTDIKMRIGGVTKTFTLL